MEQELEILQAWFGKETSGKVGKRLGIDGKEVKKCWRQLKTEKKLPSRARPHSKKMSLDSIGNSDKEIKIPDDDPLLRRLRECHPERDV